MPSNPAIGVTLAPGVRVEQREPNRQMEPSPLGTVGYVGVLERGNLEPGEKVGKLIGPIDGPTSFAKRCGGRIADSELPKVVQDYFEFAGGGRSYFARIADGTQEKSYQYAMSRGDTKERLFKIKSKNAGSWGGKRRELSGIMATLTDISSTAFDTGASVPADVWVGGNLYASFRSEDYTFPVTENNALGVLGTYDDRSFLGEISSDVGTGQHVLSDFDLLNGVSLDSLEVLDALAVVAPRVVLLMHEYNKHIVRDNYIHNVADTTNFVSLAYDEAVEGDMVALANEIKLKYNAHVVDVTSHTGVGDVIATANATDLPTLIELTNSIQDTLSFHGDFSAGLYWYVEQDNDTKRLEWELLDGGRFPNDEFGLNVYLDGALVRAWPDLSMDPTSPRYFIDMINEDPINHYIEVENLWYGSVDVIPANFSGYTEGLDTTSLTICPVNYKVTSPNSPDGLIGGWIYGEELRRDRLTVTFDGAGNYTVTSDKYDAIGTFALGEYCYGDKQYGISFVLHQGATPWAVGDTITIDVEPLEDENFGLEGDKVFVNVGDFPRISHIVKSNDKLTINARSGETFLSVGVAPTSASVLGTVASATFDTDMGLNVLEFTEGRGIERVFTLPASATLAIDDAVEYLNGVSEDLTFANEGNQLRVTSNRKGRFSSVIVGDGSANAVFGFTDDQEVLGTLGSKIRVQGGYALEGGSNGLAGIDDSNFELAFDLQTSPFNDIGDEGLVKLATPSYSDPDIQLLGIKYAASQMYGFRVEIPSDKLTEFDAVEWMEFVIGREYGEWIKTTFPSYGYVPDPDGERNKIELRSLTGIIHGIEARIARQRQGYHKAQAGESAVLSSVVTISKKSDGRELPVDLNLEFLNPKGVNGLKRINNRYYLWGNRTFSSDRKWVFANHREQMAHYARELLNNFDWVVFEMNDPSTWGLVQIQLEDYLESEYNKGALFGESASDSFFVKIDEENNPLSELEEGNMNVLIGVNLAYAIERIIFSIGRSGVTI